MEQDFFFKHPFGEEERGHLSVPSILFLLGPLLSAGLVSCVCSCARSHPDPAFWLKKGWNCPSQSGLGAGAGQLLFRNITLTPTAEVAAGRGCLGHLWVPELEICAR